MIVDAPASSANLGAGFDVFALALKEPSDRLTLEATKGGVLLEVDGAELPRLEKNAAWAVAESIMAGEGIRGGVRMRLRKGVPVGAGLGSSAASSAAASVGMDALFGLRLSASRVIEYAGVGEKVTSGAAHYDNVTAAIAGGFIVVSSGRQFVRMVPPRGLALCLATPTVPLPSDKTRFARSLVPRTLPLEEVADTVRGASMMVHGFATGSIEEIGEAMGRSFVDRSRARMIPGFREVKEAALHRGAAGVCISGAGPTMLAATEEGKAKRVLSAMIDAFGREGVRSTGFITGVGNGCRVKRHD